MSKVRIVQDIDSAQCEWMLRGPYEDFGTLATWHQRYNIGTEQPKESPQEYLANLPENSMVMPVYMYDHGGLAFSLSPFSCQWDSGQIGVWVLTPEDLKKIYGDDNVNGDARIRALKSMKARIEQMNDLENGNVWGFEVLDFDGEVCDSCYGFIGDDAVECMRDHLPENLHQDLNTAWEARYY